MEPKGFPVSPMGVSPFSAHLVWFNRLFFIPEGTAVVLAEEEERAFGTGAPGAKAFSSGGIHAPHSRQMPPIGVKHKKGVYPHNAAVHPAGQGRIASRRYIPP
jgi:hypothetical protein